MIPWSPLHGGLLGGVLRKEREGGRRTSGRAKETAGDAPASRSARTRTSARSSARSRRTSALAWLLPRPAVTAPIIGPRTMEQLDGALRALELELEDEALARLDEIFPGYKTAPQEYAW